MPLLLPLLLLARQSGSVAAIEVPALLLAAWQLQAQHPADDAAAAHLERLASLLAADPLTSEPEHLYLPTGRSAVVATSLALLVIAGASAFGLLNALANHAKPGLVRLALLYLAGASVALVFVWRSFAWRLTAHLARAVARVAERSSGQLGACLIVAVTAPMMFLSGAFVLLLWVGSLYSALVEVRIALVIVGVAVLASAACSLASAWAALETEVCTVHSNRALPHKPGPFRPLAPHAARTWAIPDGRNGATAV